MAIPAADQSKDAPRLYLLGAGVSFPEHLTLQILEILGRCTQICSNLPQFELGALPEDLRSKAVSLWPLYQENRERSDNYRDVAQVVLDAAAKNPPVAWLTPGHPLIFDSVSQTLLRDGRAQGWNVQVVPAISCLDTILADVGYDPANGLVTYECYSLVMNRIPLVPSVASLLLQPSAFGTSQTHYSSEWRANLAPLRDYLLQFYGPEHPCGFVRSRSAYGAGQIHWCELRQLNSAPFDAVGGSTLFVPPVTMQVSAPETTYSAGRPAARTTASADATPAQSPK